MIESGFVILIALAGGIAVGSGYVAFLAVLGIIPRLAQLTRSGKHIQYFEWAVIAGTLTGVLNVLPILAKRVGVEGKIVVLLIALVLGKVIGSLFHWIYFVK